MGSLDPSGFTVRIGIQGSRECKNGPEKYKTVNKFHLLKCWMFSLMAEGFSCSLVVLYVGLGTSKLQLLFFFLLKLFFSNFWTSKPWIHILIRIHLKCWIRIHIQHCCQRRKNYTQENALPRVGRKSITWVTIKLAKVKNPR